MQIHILFLCQYFSGNNLPTGSFDNFYVNSGIINQYSERSLDLENASITGGFNFHNISVSASDIFSAIRSVSRNDDEALIQEVFSGNDNFVLSNEDDVIDGFAGDDNFETGLGNDVIDGGSGTDRVKLSGNSLIIKSLINALENKFTITGSNETKTVTNVEQFDFDDVSYSSIELKEKINPINTHNPPSLANNNGWVTLFLQGF